MRRPRTRRELQSGTTLVELLVAVVIIGLALALIVGTFSSGILQSTLAKRDTASTTVVQYEMEAIGGSVYDPAAPNYSDCFATETASSLPDQKLAFGAACPNAGYTLRADVSRGPGPNGSQQWTIKVVTWPAQNQVGQPILLLKVDR